jgi:TPR repeat protein
MALSMLIRHRPEEISSLADSTCELGDGKTCASVAIDELDESIKLRIHERACQREHWASCESAARSLQPSNPEGARELYEKACRNGIDSACAVVGELRVSPTIQIDRQVRSWERQCKRGIWACCEKAGKELLQTNEKRAKRLLEVACEKGLESACASLNGTR